MMERFRRIFVFFVAAVVLTAAATVVCSCSEEDERGAELIVDPEEGVEPAERAIIMFFPWTTDLTGAFYQNITDLEQSIMERGGLDDEAVIVYISTSATEGTLFRIDYADGKCCRNTVMDYVSPDTKTAQGIASILHDCMIYAPAEVYSMIIGCHGMGWLPANEVRAYGLTDDFSDRWGPLPTRYFGGKTADFQTNIADLAAAIGACGLKMEYILFDDCYMSSIEVAYELKDVTEHLIASPTEIMAYGMPYHTIGRYLFGRPDYEAVCREFYNFYSNYSMMPCGTIAVTDCSQLECLAEVMRIINRRCSFDPEANGTVQKMDGYSPTIFYDYGDYVAKLLEMNDATDELLPEFEAQLNRTIPYKANTNYYYTNSRGKMPIATYSGVTTSDPSTSSRTATKEETAWYAATH